MGETVTFRGSRVPTDGTTTVVLPAEEGFDRLEFRKDAPVENVSKEVIERLQTQHDLRLFIFDVGDAVLDIAEPYEGYDEASADEILEYLKGADPVAVANVQAYEEANKGRKTILKYEPEPEPELTGDGLQQPPA